MKIDSETSVPIGWVLSGFAIVVASAIAGTFWVSSVNDRLSRIEEKLGIPIYKTAQTSFIPEVHAQGVKTK